MGFLSKSSHTLRQPAFGRERALDLLHDVAGKLRMLIEETALPADAVQSSAQQIRENVSLPLASFKIPHVMPDCG